MVPEIWGVTDRIFLSFWTNFCPFTPLTTRKIKIFKKWKKHLKISSFYKSISKIMIIHCTVPEIRHVTDVIFIFHFGLFFALLQIFEKMKRATRDIIILHMCTKKLWSHDVQFLRYDVQQTDRRTDRKSEILRWVAQKEMEKFLWNKNI